LQKAVAGSGRHKTEKPPPTIKKTSRAARETFPKRPQMTAFPEVWHMPWPSSQNRPSTHQIKQFSKHFDLGHAAGAQKFRKFGYRCPLCKNTGIFLINTWCLLFIHTGFNK
jgi:hypothetical protein